MLKAETYFPLYIHDSVDVGLLLFFQLFFIFLGFLIVMFFVGIKSWVVVNKEL